MLSKACTCPICHASQNTCTCPVCHSRQTPVCAQSTMFPKHTHVYNCLICLAPPTAPDLWCSPHTSNHQVCCSPQTLVTTHSVSLHKLLSLPSDGNLSSSPKHMSPPDMSCSLNTCNNSICQLPQLPITDISHPVTSDHPVDKVEKQDISYNHVVPSGGQLCNIQISRLMFHSNMKPVIPVVRKTSWLCKIWIKWKPE